MSTPRSALSSTTQRVTALANERPDCLRPALHAQVSKGHKPCTFSQCNSQTPKAEQPGHSKKQGMGELTSAKKRAKFCSTTSKRKRSKEEGE